MSLYGASAPARPLQECLTAVGHSVPLLPAQVLSFCCSAIALPKTDYPLWDTLPDALVDSGKLSQLQLEGVLYACTKHQQFLPSGEREPCPRMPMVYMLLSVHEGFSLPYSQRFYALQSILPEPIHALVEYCKRWMAGFRVDCRKKIPESLQVRASSLAMGLVWAKVVRSVASS